MKKTTFVIHIAALFFLCAGLYTQPSLLWEKRYNSSGNISDAGKYIKVDKLGNVVVAGNSGINDLFIIKYDNSGNELWNRVLTSTGLFSIAGIVIDKSNNIYISASNPSATLIDFVTVKYSPAGVLQWNQRYNYSNNGNDRAGAVCIDTSDNIYICGSNQTTSGVYGYLTVKYNSSGVLQWDTYTGTGTNDVIINDIERDIAGNLYFCGMINSIHGNANAFLNKVSPAGNFLFTQIYDYSTVTGIDRFVDIALTGSGNEIYAAGFSWGGPAYAEDFLTIKYNSSGMPQWIQRYNGPGNSIDMVGNVELDNAGNVFSAGLSMGGSTNDDIAIAKYSPTGTPMGYQRFTVGNASEIYANMIMDDQKQNFYVVGTATSDLLLIKYNTALTMQWFKNYNSSFNLLDVGLKLAVDSSDIYVTGYSEGAGTGNDMITLRYGTFVQVNQEGTSIPSEFLLYQNYPNPFNPNTEITFDIPSREMVKISVFDITGREVAVLANEFLNGGSYKVRFDASGLSSGIYFFSLQAGSFKDVKKMVLVK